MDEKYQKLLESCDEFGAYEFPSGFNYTALEQDALEIERTIQKQFCLKTEFEGMMHNQDASFSIAIILSDYILEDKGGICRPSILFSNFGRLTTMTWSELLPKELTDQIPLALDAKGFHYIPAEVLDADYDGVMKQVGNFRTWWLRYFDWL